MGRFLAFWLTISAFCWLVLGVLFSPLVPGGGATMLAIALLASAPILVLVGGFTRETYPGRAMRLFVLRPFWYIQLLLPFSGMAAMIGAAIGAIAGAFRGSVVDGALLGGRAAVIILLVVAVIFFIAGYLGSRRLVIRHFTATSPLLPEGFEGFRVVQLSDLHIGPHTPRGKLRRIADSVREAQPDLVALTGDLVDDYARDVEPFEAGLGRFAAPHGVLAIAGNHDVYAGWTAVREGLERQGITVLVNDALRIDRNGDSIAVLGTGDPAGHHFAPRGGADAAPDVARAVNAARALGTNGEFVLALAHNPVLWPSLHRARVALTLSGHTHWGQLAIPGRWSLASPFLDHAMGAYVEADSVLYVHPGTNYWGLPFRLGTPPEVAVITLRRGAPGFAPAG